MATTLLSRKKLAEALKEMGRLPETFDYKKFSNEIYGRKACIYLWSVAKDEADRRVVEAELMRRGFKVDPTYYPGSKAIEVQVSYFKGWHWDE